MASIPARCHKGFPSCVLFRLLDLSSLYRMGCVDCAIPASGIIQGSCLHVSGGDRHRDCVLNGGVVVLGGAQANMAGAMGSGASSRFCPGARNCSDSGVRSYVGRPQESTILVRETAEQDRLSIGSHRFYKLPEICRAFTDEYRAARGVGFPPCQSRVLNVHRQYA